VHRSWPNEKIVILSHVQEILKQDFTALQHYLPHDKIGLFSAGLGSRNIRQFTVAGIQSAYKVDLFREHRLVIVDEAHLIPPTGEGRYRTFFERVNNPRIVGLTATPYRLGLGMLTDGLFDKIVYNKDIVELIEAGYLCSLTTKQTKQQMNTRGVAIVGGDFNQKQMANKLDVSSVTDAICKELLAHKESRKHWLIFAIDISHAEHITAALNAKGIVTGCVHSRMKGDRTLLLDLFKQGAFQALVSVETLTTGFDAPNVDLIALLRPTMSPVLHVQMIGRGLRISPDKDNCLILDFAGNTARLGPINRITPPRLGVKSGEGKAPTRTCPVCEEICWASAAKCPSCGYMFPRDNKLLSVAADTPVIATDKTATHAVTTVRYKEHIKEGRVSLRVMYVCGMREFSEWVPLEHGGIARHKAEHWWRYRAHNTPPTTVAKALGRTYELAKPIKIVVDENGKFPVVKKCIFGE
jgi:DNA repair protein RadD